MKKIVTMQDISCVGKCSLTVALPILSAMGIETAVIPTAVLSTHTMFKDFTFHDLTNEVQPIIDHWKKEGFQFQGVYTGYLGSFEQLQLAKQVLDTFGKDTLKVVDPCMADNGKLYAGFTMDFARAMAKLCASADIICPNLTEASFLLNIPYTTQYTESYIQDILKRLTDFGCNTAILTGVSLEKGMLGAYGYDAKQDMYFKYFIEEEAPHFHGTGDIWASTLCGALLNGKTVQESIALASDFVKDSIHKTLLEPDHNIYGVNFEQAIYGLLKRLYDEQ